MTIVFQIHTLFHSSKGYWKIPSHAWMHLKQRFYEIQLTINYDVLTSELLIKMKETEE